MVIHHAIDQIPKNAFTENKKALHGLEVGTSLII